MHRRLSIYGTGYVGLVSAACFAQLETDVLCLDVDVQKIKRLRQGDCPIYEQGLPELLREQHALGRLGFTHQYADAIQHADIHMIAVGTPSLTDGSTDLTQVFSVARDIVHHLQGDAVVVIKSTVPVGTGDALAHFFSEELSRLAKPWKIDVLSNPEFLREGSAVADFLQADRIIIGGDHGVPALLALYQNLPRKDIPIHRMSRRSAELTKYTSNVMLACRISLMNQISRIAETLGADIEEVRKGIASDHRIGPHFLQAGIGFGGSCFPKDIRSLIHTAQQIGVEAGMLQAIYDTNESQKNWVFNQLTRYFHTGLQGLTVGLWGLAFKPNTDDIREASSLVIIKTLLASQVHLRVYDPVAMPAIQQYFGHHPLLIWCDSAMDVLCPAVDALVIATEWDEFKNQDLTLLAHQLSGAPIFDGRNCFELKDTQFANLSYYSVGRPVACASVQQVTKEAL